MSVTLPRPSRTTGVDELTRLRIVSPMPEHLRVSVFGPGQQIDITLPADARVADVLPYLSRLIARRATSGIDPAATADDRTERTLLRRGAADGDTLPAAQTLRDAGVRHGDMLFLCTERTLVPPTLHDDVVDAAAHLNRTAYAGWDRLSAATMACVALYACVGMLAWMSLDGRFQPVRPVVIGIDLIGALTLLTAATVAHRMHLARWIAAVCAWAAMPLIGAALLSALAGLPGWGPVIVCATLIAVSYGSYRLVGTGRWGFLSGSLCAAFAGLTLCAGTVSSLPDDVLGVLACLAALALCCSVPRLTTGWDRPARHAGSGTRTAGPDAFADPFRGADPDDSAAGPAPLDSVPTAEEVVAQGKRAAELRAAFYAGAGAAVVFGTTLMLNASAAPRWPVLVFSVVCAAVLSLRARVGGSMIEQSCLLVAGTVVALQAVVSATSGPPPYAIAGLVGVAVMVAVGAAAGVVAGGAWATAWRRRAVTMTDYLDYLCVSMLIPLAVAVIDGYALVQDFWA